MSLPNVSQQQIDAMMRAAEKKFGKQEELPQPVHQEVVDQPVEETLQNLEPSDSEKVSDVIENEDQLEVEPVEEVEEEPVAETKNQKNLRLLREKAERAERLEKERDELLKHVLSYQQGSDKKQVKEVEPAEEDYLSSFGLDEDSLVEGKHFKAYLKKQRELEKELAQYKQKSTQDSVELKLKSQYPDFDKVVSAQNLSQLREINPDLADMILATPDLYKQASIAYQMVKQYGIYQDKTFQAEKQIIAKNMAKPRSAAGAAPQSGSTPMSQANVFANGLTPELKKQLYKEMTDAARNRG